MKGQDNLQSTSVKINREVNIYINFWTKFPLLNDRQPSKVLKSETVSRQKWKKLTVNRQSYHPNDILLIEYVVPFKSVDKSYGVSFNRNLFGIPLTWYYLFFST